MQIETRLGHYAMDGHPFKVRLPDIGTYSPEYEINPIDLIENAIIGHVVMLPSGPTFVISRIVRLDYETAEHDALKWPSHITTEPILHHWDTRTMEQLKVARFYLDVNSIQCIMRKQQFSD